MSGLTNSEVDFFGKKLLKHFIGVYPCDLLPQSRKKYYCFIVNLDHHYEKGSHFVSLYIKNKFVFYFDSLGEKCNNLHILDYVKKLNKKLIVQSTKIQSNDSIFCGLYAIAYLMCVENKIPIIKFKKIFISDLKMNDKLVVNFISNLFKYNKM